MVIAVASIAGGSPEEDIPTRRDGDAIVSSSVPADFNVFVYMLEGDAEFGANRLRASRSQIAVLGPGGALSMASASPGTRFMLMAGKPYGESPIYNGPYVD